MTAFFIVFIPCTPGSRSDTVITLKNITKTYGGAAQIQALKGINLTIEDGEIFGIIGKSGAGKSTLVRCINMLENRPAAKSSSTTKTCAK